MKNIETQTQAQPGAPSTVAQVQEAIERITGDRARLVEARISLDQRLEMAQREMGEKYLRGERSHLKEVSALTIELEALERALGLLEEQEIAAKVELERAKARELRGKAAAIRQQLESLNQKTAPLLAQLGALEGVTFTRSILSSQPVFYMPNDTNKATKIWTKPLTIQLPDEHQGVSELSLNHAIAAHWQRVALPRSRAILLEAEEMENQAREIEQKLP